MNIQIHVGGRRSRRTWAVVATAAAVALSQLAPSTAAVPPRAQASSAALAIGVYRGPGPWGAALISEYEQRMRVSVDYVLDYQDVDTWDNQTWPSWQADVWQKERRTVILGGTGVFPTGGSWALAARGDYDKNWRKLGERLVATGQAGAILRGAHEFNGDWFHYKVTAADTGEFIAAWRRWVDIMRAVPGQKFTFDWNPIIGIEQLRHPDDAYPGDKWVDRIAIDVYDGYYERGWDPKSGSPPTDTERDAVWNTIVNGERGLQFWRRFASARSKPLSIPEWGLRDWTETTGKSHGGGDNPTFISRMHALMTDPAWNVAYHAPWEDPGYGLSDPDNHPKRVVSVPASRERFLSLTWRSGTSAAPSVTTPAPKVSAAVESAAVPSRAIRQAVPKQVTPTTRATTNKAGSTTAFALGATPGVIDGVTWRDLRSSDLVSNGYLVCDRSTPFVPSAPQSVQPLLGCGVYQNPLEVKVSNVTNGQYDVYLTVWENDYPEPYTISLQGVPVAARNSSGAGSWARLGPFRVTVSTGQVRLDSKGWLSNLSGIELHPVGVVLATPKTTVKKATVKKGTPKATVKKATVPATATTKRAA